MLKGIAENAIIESSRLDMSDYMCSSKNYFSCGFSKEPYYNNQYAIAIAIIGRLYGEETGKHSDYCKGIRYVAETCKLSRGQVKSLRKNFKTMGGYKCKIPYEVCRILNEMIGILQKSDDPIVHSFLNSQQARYYRNILLDKHDVAISICAANTKSEKVKRVRSDLDKITASI